MRRVVPVALVAASLLIAAGCGGGGKSGSSQGSKLEGSPGQKVFVDAGCSGCHTLAAAGATGTIGPNLDELRPNKQTVARQVRTGGNGMPSFASKLSASEIKQVAGFVATAAGTGQAGKISFEPDDTKVEDCQDQGCYEQAFGNIAYEEGPKAALDKLAEMAATVGSGCHPIAHKIGAGALLKYEGNVGAAFAAGNATCGAGYYHGLLQWKLAGLRANQVAGVARNICDAPEIKTNAFNYYQCDHGLGHGLMLYSAYDLPQALGFCHQLNSEFDKVACSGGVFMENQSSSFGLRTTWLSNKNLLYPCNSKIVQTRDKLYCYLLVTSHILPGVGGSWTKTADWCRRADKGHAASGETWVDICFQSYGRDVSGASVQNAEQIRQLCANAGNGEKECLYGAVRDVLNNNSQDLQAKALCEAVKPAYKSRCYFGIGSILGTYHSDAEGKRTACEEFAEGKNLADCVSGAGG